MGKIPASYYVRKALTAEDVSKSLEFYAYFHKQMLTHSFFTLKAYSDAWIKYFKKFTSVV